MKIDKRVELYKQLPLQMPFSLHVFVTGSCNFRCGYCVQSLSNEQLKAKHFAHGMLDIDGYKKAIDSLNSFQNPLKATIFAGHGEPLLHPHIAKMVNYAKRSNMCGRVEIVTNGSLLTKELSDELIDANLDRLRISLQGLNAQKYYSVAHVKINFESFMSNIEYYFKHKNKNQELVVKIIDVALDFKEDYDKFQNMFSSISDYALLEHATPVIEQVDTGIYKNELSSNKHGGKMEEVLVCAMPFYMMAIHPDGRVSPCCAEQIPLSMGNVREQSLYNIWNGSERNEFMKMQLSDRGVNKVCKHCNRPDYDIQEGDNLDEYKSLLLKRMYDE